MRHATVLVSLALATACSKAPVTNRNALNLVPDGQMASLGSDAFKETLAQSKLSTDADLNARIERIGARLVKAAEEHDAPENKWQLAVLDEPKTANAFALPGGKMAVYTGLLSVAGNEAALAAVIGHEVAHVTARHGNERVSQAVIVELGLTAAALTLGDSQYRGVLLGALGLGLQFGALMPFSRLHESEADEIGLIYAARAGYDPREAVGLWERMGKAGGAEPPEFMSTHPNHSTRIQDLNEQMERAMAIWEKSEQQPSTKL